MSFAAEILPRTLTFPFVVTNYSRLFALLPCSFTFRYHSEANEHFSEARLSLCLYDITFSGKLISGPFPSDFSWFFGFFLPDRRRLLSCRLSEP